jgi:hypothetical protein
MYTSIQCLRVLNNTQNVCFFIICTFSLLHRKLPTHRRRAYRDHSVHVIRLLMSSHFITYTRGDQTIVSGIFVYIFLLDIGQRS